MSVKISDQSSENVVGFIASGEVTKGDYAVMDPAIAGIVKEYGSVYVMVDLTDFEWEKLSAWGSDFDFGHKYHEKIERMAIVGPKKWQKALAALAKPFYAKDAKYFDDAKAAWVWLEEGAKD